MRKKESFPVFAITNPNKAWVCEEIDSLIREWKDWNDYCQNLEESKDYNPQTCTEAIKDGFDNRKKHEILREKTLVFMRNHLSGAEFVLENWPSHPHENNTARLRDIVPGWIHRLEILKASMGSIGDIGGDVTLNIDQSEGKSGEDQTETVAEHKVFISHSHGDSGIASRLIDVIETYLRVPPGTIKCTSVPDYELDLGVLTSEELSLELNSAELVIALLSPNSINAEWVLFELGAAWGRNCKTIPLLTGGLTMDDLPGPLKGRNAGELQDIGVLRQLVDNVGKITGWRTDKVRNAETKMESLVSYLETLEWPRQQNRSLKIPRTLLRDFEISYLARKNRLPLSQRRLLEIVERGTTVAQWLHQKVIRQHFGERDPYWRLEQLCCLGFLERRASGVLVGGRETFNYNLTSEYRHELAETYPEAGV